MVYGACDGCGCALNECECFIETETPMIKMPTTYLLDVEVPVEVSDGHEMIFVASVRGFYPDHEEVEYDLFLTDEEGGAQLTLQQIRVLEALYGANGDFHDFVYHSYEKYDRSCRDSYDC